MRFDGIGEPRGKRWRAEFPAIQRTSLLSAVWGPKRLKNTRDFSRLRENSLRNRNRELIQRNREFNWLGSVKTGNFLGRGRGGVRPVHPSASGSSLSDLWKRSPFAGAGDRPMSSMATISASMAPKARPGSATRRARETVHLRGRTSPAICGCSGEMAMTPRANWAYSTIYGNTFRARGPGRGLAVPMW